MARDSYLLECAEGEDRDLKLAEEVVRWAEDQGVAWTWVQGPQRGRIFPRIENVDRHNNAPLAVHMLAALVFEQLARKTSNPLWSAKGESLARAALAGHDPKTGRPTVNLDTAFQESPDRSFLDFYQVTHAISKPWAAQLSREYAALRERQ